MVVDAHEIALRLTRLDMLVHTELETGAGTACDFGSMRLGIQVHISSCQKQTYAMFKQ